MRVQNTENSFIGIRIFVFHNFRKSFRLSSKVEHIQTLCLGILNPTLTQKKADLSISKCTSKNYLQQSNMKKYPMSITSGVIYPFNENELQVPKTTRVPQT